jgi:hypothetical protein
MREAEVLALFEGLEARPAEKPCVNVRYRRDGVIVFADTPDVPLSSVHTLATRARRFGSAAALVVAAACAPRSQSIAPEDFESDHVDGEVLTAEGEQPVSRGRAHAGRMFHSKRMRERTTMQPPQWEETAGAKPEAVPAIPEAGPTDVDGAAAGATALRDRLSHALEQVLPGFDVAMHVRDDEGTGFTIAFARDVSWHEPENCPPGAKCSMQMRFDSNDAVMVHVDCWTGPWMGTAVIQEIRRGALGLRVQVDAARPDEGARIRAAIDRVLAAP